MMVVIFIAMAAGGASALMFASIVSGALISLVLFCLAPLPLMVAAMGWGPRSAAIGGIAAATCLGALFGFAYCIAFVMMVALPAWWLGQLALLGRPLSVDHLSNKLTLAAPPDMVPDLEWYPVGRILLWVAGFVVLIVMATLLTIGTDAITITDTLQHGFAQLLSNAQAASTEIVDTWAYALARIVPASTAIFLMTTLTLNLWLSTKITIISGRLRRPRPDLKSVEMPPMTMVAFLVAIAFCFIGGMIAILAQTFAAALMMAYALIGFAVLHTLTLALKNRALWLSCIYTSVVLFSWPVLVMAALGLADSAFGLRLRYLRSKPPPLPIA